MSFPLWGSEGATASLLVGIQDVIKSLNSVSHICSQSEPREARATLGLESSFSALLVGRRFPGSWKQNWPCQQSFRCLLSTVRSSRGGSEVAPRLLSGLESGGGATRKRAAHTAVLILCWVQCVGTLPVRPHSRVSFKAYLSQCPVFPSQVVSVFRPQAGHSGMILGHSGDGG